MPILIVIEVDIGRTSFNGIFAQAFGPEREFVI